MTNVFCKARPEIIKFVEEEIQLIIEQEGDSEDNPDYIVLYNSQLYAEKELYGVTVKDDGVVVGFAEFLTEKETGEEGLTISSIFIKRDFRGRGYGRKILKSIEEHGKSLGYTAFFAQVISKEALSLFESSGYRSQFSGEHLWVFKRI